MNKEADRYFYEAFTSFESGRYEKSLKNCHAALNILLSSPEPDSAEIAKIYTGMGGIYRSFNEYDNALKYLKRAEEMQVATASDSFEIAVTYTNLGLYYADFCDYDKALDYIDRAFKIFMKSTSDSSIIAKAYSNMGFVYLRMGRHEEALKQFRRAEKLISKDSLFLSVVNINLGVCLRDLGRHDEALTYHLRALNIQEKILPKDSIDKAITYNSIGITYNANGQHQKALEYHEQALKIRKKVLPDSLETAQSHQNKCGVFISLKKPKKAIDEANYARRIYDNISLPQDNILRGILYCSLGDAYVMLNPMNKKALKCYSHALHIFEPKLPLKGDSIATLYDRSANIQYLNGNIPGTFEYIAKLSALLPSLYEDAMMIFNEGFRLHKIRRLSGYLDTIHSASYTHFGGIEPSESYSLLLKTKDISAEAEFAVRAYLPDRYPEHKEKFTLLQNMQISLQQLEVNDMGGNDILRLKKEIQNLEDELAPYVREISFSKHMSNLSISNIMENIPLGSALLEFGWFNYDWPFADQERGVKPGGRYYAYLLCGGEISLRYLEAEDIVHTELYALREKIVGEKSEIEGVHGELQELHRLLITPFMEKLQGLSHLYIAPDGELYKLPFELLRDESGSALSEMLSINYLSSGRDFVRPKKWNKPFESYNSIAILADPSYDLPDGFETQRDAELERGASSVKSREVDKLEKCTRLLSTRAEADALDRVFKGEKERLYELEAKKTALFRLGATDIIHIATHGFYLKKRLKEDTPFTPDRKDAYGYAEDPLIRCGLMFAGVNDWLDPAKHDPPDDYGDGILTAKEVLSLDLHETDMLVLSACETGLGDSNNGEGIQGLRRAI